MTEKNSTIRIIGVIIFVVIAMWSVLSGYTADNIVQQTYYRLTGIFWLLMALVVK